MKTLTIEPRSAAVVGLLLTVPLAILNAIIGDRVEPFFSLIRPGLHTSPGEYVLLVAVLLLLPMGAVIAIRPMLETRRLYLINVAVAALLLVGFVAVSIALVRTSTGATFSGLRTATSSHEFRLGSQCQGA